MVSVNTMIV